LIPLFFFFSPRPVNVSRVRDFVGGGSLNGADVLDCDEALTGGMLVSLAVYLFSFQFMSCENIVSLRI
jgi:hypothetical protein